MESWQTQEAKARFSELAKKAARSPQLVTMRGKPAVVVISQKEYLRLRKPKPSFLEFMQASPFDDGEFEIDRDMSTPRKIDL
ncbi:antitoxin [Synergistales bacterium]|nr:antitoxin [Synergistales bacterium]